jgi:coniferyl-aldehyde dehydrogenase
MSIIEHIVAASADGTNDAQAIANLRSAFDRQRAAFATDRDPPLAERRARIEALIGMMAANRERISAALAADFGSHPTGAAELIEVLGVLGRAQYVLAHLEEWMAPSVRETDPALLGTATASVRYQPKGVIGNIAPWNFPFDIGIGPMIEMLGAGNRVILKPSDYTPACGALLAEMVAAAFDPAIVHVANGGVELARAFAALPWDHLLYTGSPGVGREVMTAAAANLTPVTLELGGKCPAILTPGSVRPDAVKSIVGTKTIKNGQMCVSVDYCLVPRADLETFVDLARAHMTATAPDYSRSLNCTGIVSLRHLDRLGSMLDEAGRRRTRIVPLEDGAIVDRATRRMPISLVIDPAADLALMKEEIFGPILPVLPYDDLDAAIALVNAGDRPLGLYVFGDDAATIEHVLAMTTSGGASVNACALQGALPSLGFGGSGTSGMGRHHGIEGFREFSNQRGVVARGTGDMIDAFYAPYEKAEAIVQMVLAGG